MGRALLALWIACAAVLAGVWLRPMHEGVLPEAPAHAARARPRAVDPRHGAVAQPEDEPVAEEPAAEPVHSGPPEQLNRHDLENALDKLKPKVLQCRSVEQFSGFVSVRLTIERNGSVRSIVVLPPVDKTLTADCVKHALHGLSFPRFRGTYVPQIEWTYPFLFAPDSAPAAAGR